MPARFPMTAPHNPQGTAGSEQPMEYVIPAALLEDVKTCIRIGCDGTLPNEGELLRAIVKYARPHTSAPAPASWQFKEMKTLHDKECFMAGYREGEKKVSTNTDLDICDDCSFNDACARQAKESCRAAIRAGAAKAAREQYAEELKKDLKSRIVSQNNQWCKGRNSGLIECCNIIDESLRSQQEAEQPKEERR